MSNPAPHERSAQIRAERRRIRAERAFEDYWAMGLTRSKHRLWQMYREKKQKGEEVPTTRKQDIADWSREFNWEERVAKREKQQLEEVRRQTALQRERFVDDMTLLLDSAVVALSELINNSDGQTPPHVRLKAVELLTDRLNLKVGSGQQQTGDKQSEDRLKLPPKGASESEIRKYLADIARPGGQK